MKRVRASAAVRSRPRVALLVETSLASGRDILSGIARYVHGHEPWALYHEPRSLEEAVPRWLRRWTGEGIIARIQNRDIAAEITAIGVPVVDVLGVVPDLPFPLVHVNDVAIARMAADHLLERGFRHFGFFGIEGESWSQRRRSAFSTALAQAGCDLMVCELPRDAAGRRSWERIENTIARWVAALPKPAGVMVCSDQRGAQFLEACHRAGVQIPDELAVIGVDDDQPLCEVCDPTLSSIAANHALVGYRAAEVLASLLRGAAPARRPVVVEPQRVVTRRSTDVLAIDDAPIASALQLIREHAHEGLQVEMIARRVGLSRSVLQRRFRGLLGRSVHQEILAARIKRARELLLKTNLSLAAVAERAGFKHQEYMGAVFRARVGLTPGQVRRTT